MSYSQKKYNLEEIRYKKLVKCINKEDIKRTLDKNVDLTVELNTEVANVVKINDSKIAYMLNKIDSKISYMLNRDSGKKDKGIIKIFNVYTGKCMLNIEYISKFKVIERLNNSQLVCYSSDNIILVWDINTGICKQTITLKQFLRC